MQLPFLVTDFCFLFAVASIILLITAEMYSPYYGHTNLLISNKRLKSVATSVGFLFC